MITTEQQRKAEEWGRRQAWLKADGYPGFTRESILFDDDVESVCSVARRIGEVTFSDITMGIRYRQLMDLYKNGDPIWNACKEFRNEPT